MRLLTLAIFSTMLLALSIPASADVSMADWCVNLNGNINVCNGGTSPGGLPNVIVSAFDATLEPSSNAVATTPGTITVKIGTGAQYAAVYMDYDVDYATTTGGCPSLGCGSFTDVGSVSGSPSGTQSYELADPNVSNIFSDFSGNSLANTNTVDAATCSANAPQFCDVSWSLGESLNVNSALFSGGTVTFTVSSTAPRSGFYLQQTNGVTGNSIYLSDVVSLTPLSGPPPPVPEPASMLLLATVALAVLVLFRRSGANAESLRN